MWRSNSLALLQGARAGCLELHGESAVTRALHSLARDINVLSADQLRGALRGVVAAAGSIDADFGERQRDADATALQYEASVRRRGPTPRRGSGPPSALGTRAN